MGTQEFWHTLYALSRCSPPYNMTACAFAHCRSAPTEASGLVRLPFLFFLLKGSLGILMFSTPCTPSAPQWRSPVPAASSFKFSLVGTL